MIISGFMLLLGLFFLCADNVLVGAIGLLLFAGAAYREGAFYK